MTSFRSRVSDAPNTEVDSAEGSHRSHCICNETKSEWACSARPCREHASEVGSGHEEEEEHVTRSAVVLPNRLRLCAATEEGSATPDAPSADGNLPNDPRVGDDTKSLAWTSL
jgi:hypothetical protein